MGQRGSDVSREVADLVLMDDNIATIVAAIEEGRSIYENIQKFIRFLFSTNLSEVLVVALGMVFAALLNLRDEAGYLLLPLTAERRLKGVAEVQEVLEGMLRERYAPRTQTLTHKS